MTDENPPDSSGEPDDAEDLDVTYENVDEIIGIAERKKQAAAERIGRDDLEEVAEELGIDAEYVDAALRELQKQRARRNNEKRERARWHRNVAIGAVVTVCAVASVVVYDTVRLQNHLNELHQQRAQVDNVVDRLDQTHQYFANRGEDPARSPELQGALNRVTVETRRYDEAASRYNRRASGVPGFLVVRVLDLPNRVALSDEVDSW